MSVHADCFVVIGLAKYAEVAGDEAAYAFADRLYRSICERIERGDFNTLPYPLSPEYRAHGIPMILSNVTHELHAAAKVLHPEACAALLRRLDGFTQDILTHFVDENNVIHEVITRENTFFPDILGQHANPGHTIEDMWFMVDAADLLHKREVETKACDIALKAFEIGWDQQMGGLLHFSGIYGGKPEGNLGQTAEEPMCRQLSGWDDKLWWIHAEALYTSLLCYSRTGDERFLQWHERVFGYTFETFPNRDPEIREWMQIRMRDGRPQEKVVALPVKDPFHITRDLYLILSRLIACGKRARKARVRRAGMSARQPLGAPCAVIPGGEKTSREIHRSFAAAAGIDGLDFSVGSDLVRTGMVVAVMTGEFPRFWPITTLTTLRQTAPDRHRPHGTICDPDHALVK